MGAAIGVGLALVSHSGERSVLPYLALAAGSGVSMAVGNPAARAMPPTLVPRELLASANAPRGALLYPRCSREELKGGSWA